MSSEISLLTWSAVVFAAVSGASLCGLVARRLARGKAARRGAEAEARLRPLALALLEGDETAVPLDKEDAAVLASLLSRLGRSLRGDTRDRIARFFEARGAVELELRHLHATSGWKRATAAYTLGDMGSGRAIPALLGALDDPNRDVRSAAARSLGRLEAVEAVQPLVFAFAQQRVPRAVAGQALLSVGVAALVQLRDLQAATDPQARAFAVELVGLLGNASDGAPLLGRLHDSSAEVRAKAARALGRLGAAEGAAGLVAALDDRIDFVRTSAAHALAVVGDRSAIPPLLRVAREDAYDAARAAAYAVAVLDPRALAHAAETSDAGPFVVETADVIGAVR